MAEFNFKNIFLAGVGMTAYSIEKTQEMVEDLVKKGELTVQQGKVVSDELKHSMAAHGRAFWDGFENGSKKAVDLDTMLNNVEKLTPEQRSTLLEKLNQLDGQEQEPEA